MEHHESWFTAFLNKVTGLHIPDHVAMSILVVLIGVVFVMWLKPRLSVERPGATQQVMEWLITNPLGAGIRDVLDQNVHHHPEKYVAAVGSVSLFILLCNLISVVPGLTSPTGTLAGPLACALVTFIYFNAQGFRQHGVGGYIKHFTGPGGPIGWALILPVEIISTTARILSLTVRLWANMFSSELIYFIFLGLLLRPTALVLEKMPILAPVIGIFPATIPVLFIGLHLFVAVVQAFVFTLLPAVYIGMATAEEH
jgi:F-type H+-transporting ATPase subunit a